MDENVEKNIILATKLEEKTENMTYNAAEEETEEILEEQENKQDIIEQEEIKEEDNPTTNCLALTVRKSYNIAVIKNIITTSGRITWKIALSTIALNFLRMFL